jgi:tetratricopeptide (TPR) repeat protein
MKRNRFLVALFLIACLLFSGCATGPKKYADDFFNEGVAWFQKGEYDRSADEFSKAIEMSPEGRETYVVYYNRGLAYSRNRDYDKAIEDFTTSIQLTPGERPDQKQTSGAHDSWMAIKPPSPKIKYELFNVHKARGDAWFCKEAYQQAIDDYTLALRYGELRKELPSVHECRGWARLQQGNLDRAINDFSIALSMNPRLPQAYFGRARAWSKKGNTDKALQDAQKALDLKPGCKDYDDLVYTLKSSQKK